MIKFTTEQIKRQIVLVRACFNLITADMMQQLLDRVDELEAEQATARAALEKTASQLDVEHADYMLGKGRDPAKYVSQWSRAADSIRATLKGLGE